MTEITVSLPSFYYENLSRVKNGAKKHPLHNPLLKTYERYVAVRIESVASFKFTPSFVNFFK